MQLVFMLFRVGVDCGVLPFAVDLAAGEQLHLTQQANLVAVELMHLAFMASVDRLGGGARVLEDVLIDDPQWSAQRYCADALAAGAGHLGWGRAFDHDFAILRASTRSQKTVRPGSTRLSSRCFLASSHALNSIGNALGLMPSPYVELYASTSWSAR